jgi:ankyrin repeat protein
VKQLIDTKQYDINAKNYSGHANALLEASFDGSPIMVSFLLDNGANINSRNYSGRTCFDISKEYNPKVYEYLILRYSKIKHKLLRHIKEHFIIAEIK